MFKTCVVLELSGVPPFVVGIGKLRLSRNCCTLKKTWWDGEAGFVETAALVRVWDDGTCLVLRPLVCAPGCKALVAHDDGILRQQRRHQRLKARLRIDIPRKEFRSLTFAPKIHKRQFRQASSPSPLPVSLRSPLPMQHRSAPRGKGSPHPFPKRGRNGSLREIHLGLCSLPRQSIPEEKTPVPSSGPASSSPLELTASSSPGLTGLS